MVALHGEALTVYRSLESRVIDAGVKKLTPTGLLPFLVGLDVSLFERFTDREAFAEGPVEQGITSIKDLVSCICRDLHAPDSPFSLPAAYIKVTVIGLNLEAICQRIKVC